MRRRCEPQTVPFCDTGILTFEDQRTLGAKARTILCSELEKLPIKWCGIRFEIEDVENHLCCMISRRWKLPCIHLLRSRWLRIPRLSRDDFPPTVFLHLPVFRMTVSHTISHIGPDLTCLDPVWNYRGILEYIDSLINSAAKGNREARDIIRNAHTEFLKLQRRTGPNVGIKDPRPTRGVGRPNTHPSRNSRLDARSHGQADTSRCVVCGSREHNPDACPDRRSFDQYLFQARHAASTDKRFHRT
jgi:hypothetical protein